MSVYDEYLKLTLEDHYTDVDKSTLGTSGRTVHVYAINYNILKIKNDIASLTYAN